MKAVYTELHRSHDPQFFLVRGVVKRTTEQPERADRLLAGLKAGKHECLAVTTEGFRRIGQAIARIGLPTVFVQEGGYLSDMLGANLTACDDARMGEEGCSPCLAEEARCRRKHTLLPWTTALRAAGDDPATDRWSLHRCLKRHGITRLPQIEGDTPVKQQFKAYRSVTSTSISPRSAPRKASCTCSWRSIGPRNSPLSSCTRKPTSGPRQISSKP